MGDLKRAAGDYPGAWGDYEQAQTRYMAIEHGYSLARVLYRMGDWHAEQANPTAAVELYRQAIALWEAIGLPDLAAQIIAPKLARIADRP